MSHDKALYKSTYTLLLTLAYLFTIISLTTKHNVHYQRL